MVKRVEITLGADGSIKTEAFEFTGKSCTEATEFLDKLFGKSAGREFKDEYYTEEEIICDPLPSGHCG